MKTARHPRGHPGRPAHARSRGPSPGSAHRARALQRHGQLRLRRLWIRHPRGGHVRGRVHAQGATTAGAPPYFFDNYETHEILSANGRWLTIDHQGIYKDLRITHVERDDLPVRRAGGGPAVRHPGQRRQRADPRPGPAPDDVPGRHLGDTDLDNDDLHRGQLGAPGGPRPPSRLLLRLLRVHDRLLPGLSPVLGPRAARQARSRLPYVVPYVRGQDDRVPARGAQDHAASGRAPTRDLRGTAHPRVDPARGVGRSAGATSRPLRERRSHRP